MRAFSAASICRSRRLSRSACLWRAGGVGGGVGGEQVGEQGGAFGAKDPLVEELGQGGVQVVFADGDGAGVVGGGGGVAGVAGVVGAQVVGAGGAGDAAHPPFARAVADQGAQFVGVPGERVRGLAGFAGDGVAAVADGLGGVVQVAGDDGRVGGFG